MSNEVVAHDFFMEPGYVCLPAKPTRLAAVVTSGVAVTIYDTRRKRGGMSHYVEPRRRRGISTAMYAAPAIVSLVKMFTESGSSADDLEAHMYGGARNNECPRYDEAKTDENLEVGRELLRKLGVPVSGEDVGGRRARKVVFHSASGETVVAKVDRVRVTDWYPEADADERENAGGTRN